MEWAYLGVVGETRMTNDDDLNALTPTQLTANGSIIDLRTEESYADMT